MRHALVAVTAVLLAGCATAPASFQSATLPAAAAPAFISQPLDPAIPSDLPRIARPLHYEITIEPDAANLTFTGSSQARLEIYQPTMRIVMHAIELDFGAIALLDTNGTKLADLEVGGYDSVTQAVEFRAPMTIVPGTYQLSTEYTGTINTQAVGLFALDYPDKITGEDRRGLFTQFQAPDARRFAPMFDEPAYKATFDLSAIIPIGQMGVSNMPVASETDLGDGRKRVTFETSPKMSSYLLYFGAGDFERASMIATDGTDVGIIAPTGSGEQAQYALEGLTQVTPWFADYFGLAYPLPKLDNITGPGQSQFFAAMENWGAILTFERYLLNDPAITSPAQRQTIYDTQVHEVAHQWFGNIVTMAWWDDLWLNEGFASWLDTKVTHHFHPEWQRNLTQVGVRERAMGLDAYANTHPVIQDISTVAETTQAFDGITYAKGEAVIAMFEAYAGEDVWRTGLQAYLAQHAYGNTVNTDLWQAMEAAGAGGLTDIAEDFTRQGGVPLVIADGRCFDGQTTLTLEQSQFSRDRRAATAANPGHWLVPLRITSGPDEARAQVLDRQLETMTPGCDAPLVLNSGQLGYFRTLYSADLLRRIVAGFDDLEAIDQLGLLRDNAALSASEYQPLDAAMALLEAVPGDANPLVASYAVGAWADAYDTLGEEHMQQRAQIAAIASQTFAPRLAQLGFEPVDGELVVDTNLRAELIQSLGAMGDAEVAQQANGRFAALATDPRAMDGPIKATWLSIASANAAPDDWDLLAQLATSSTSTVERQSYYRALGSARDETLAQAALDFALTGEAGTASAAIITRVSVRYPERAFAFVMDNYEAVRGLVDASGWQGYVADLADGSTDPELLARLVELRQGLPGDEAVPVTRVIDAMRLRMESEPRQEAALLVWLAGR